MKAPPTLLALLLSVSPALAVDESLINCGATAMALRATFQEEAARGNDDAVEAAALAGGIMLEAMWIVSEETKCSPATYEVYEEMQGTARQLVKRIVRKQPNAGFEEIFQSLAKQLDMCRDKIGRDRFEQMTSKVREHGAPCQGIN